MIIILLIDCQFICSIKLLKIFSEKKKIKNSLKISYKSKHNCVNIVNSLHDYKKYFWL